MNPNKKTTHLLQRKHPSRNDPFLHKRLSLPVSAASPPSLLCSLPPLRTVIMLVVSLLPQAPPHKHISEQLSKMGVSARPHAGHAKS